jgi:hypothetical protein
MVASLLRECGNCDAHGYGRCDDSRATSILDIEAHSIISRPRAGELGFQRSLGTDGAKGRGLSHSSDPPVVSLLSAPAELFEFIIG